MGTVIIPAHNEAAVLPRTLDSLAQAISSGTVEVIVACNGCTDQTAAVARSYPRVRVIEIGEASKTAALNAADRTASHWPRLYLDADIELTLDALFATLELLAGSETVYCARPAFRYDYSGATWPVRAYYRARTRLPQSAASMWGAGVYGVNEKGHNRLGEFPPVTADDCLIDRLYRAHEKAVVPCHPVTVHTPRTARALIATLKRIYRGNGELQHLQGSHTVRTVRELAGSVHSLLSAFDAVVYGVFALLGRRPDGKGGASRTATWERDETSRTDTRP
ncbi:glycosyltransferase family 2 protein [Arthrobacter sp. ISL-85]|uniref:glycosyltransferase n=1 Tax=Arthrobacter sp. ISL-85 TaxID=2819115 RepID=UPI001BE8B4A5|nr:glycosyltransferase family 2 protein [Arthrobacter sp. ISL-85]MBT2567576.1 glycosyltransferase family 2 protein [Arthrobacter sp. ISL-85]